MYRIVPAYCSEGKVVEVAADNWIEQERYLRMWCEFDCVNICWRMVEDLDSLLA